MIRAYKKQDDAELIKIWYEASIIAHSFIPSTFWEAEKKSIQEKYLPLAETYVKEIDGQIVGFISLIEDYIGGLFVHPNCQGKGVGTELINKAKSLRPKLTVEVYQENTKAQRFYGKCGFTLTGERVQPETGCILLAMEFSLP
ncbi:N-acetyltransferase [Desulforamulus ferrireducens]|uniref:N-acetyltransferase n=1 Tax=Desulforamulus ferrireducens TaxID=1833852 RepID=A0A1S6IZ04_9FIRM|nr:N-acetyltransferase [Desulforamulus ferrireducens]AQS59999.1 N-acetyltransferase [Desulforamulus ferrireducens]